MNAFPTTAADWLLRASWQAAILALFILLISWLFASHLSAAMRYNLWMLIVLRLLLPALPTSKLSIHNLLSLPQKQTPIAPPIPIVDDKNLDVVVLSIQHQTYT